MPACAPGWCWPMAGWLATQCLPPSAVRSIHDRTVVLSPAKPAIAAMPVLRSANAMARAWYLPRSSPGLRDRLPEAAGPDVLPGGPADLDGVAVACEAPLVTRPAGPPALLPHREQPGGPARARDRWARAGRRRGLSWYPANGTPIGTLQLGGRVKPGASRKTRPVTIPATAPLYRNTAQGTRRHTAGRKATPSAVHISGYPRKAAAGARPRSVSCGLHPQQPGTERPICTRRCPALQDSRRGT